MHSVVEVVDLLVEAEGNRRSTSNTFEDVSRQRLIMLIQVKLGCRKKITTGTSATEFHRKSIAPEDIS